MRTAKRLAVVGIISILAIGVAPATRTATAGGKVSPNMHIPCCRADLTERPNRTFGRKGSY